MSDFTDDQLSYLERYGFDPLLFENWRKSVREGWLSRASNVIEGELRPPGDEEFSDIPRASSDEGQRLAAIGRAAIARGELGMVVLNGGMATRFGGAVKGIVDVLGGGRSFLSLRCQDIRDTQEACGSTIPLFLMNSFATDEPTREHCEEQNHFGLDPANVHHFTQFISARMTPEGDVFRDANGDPSWYGPGHGDFGPALRASGHLERFLGGGGKYLFLSNVDNVAARISPVVLGHHIESRSETTVELAPKWPGDVGGSPFDIDGKVQLVEQIRYPEGFDPDVVDVFNTNTFHFSAAALDRDFQLGWYFVEKTVSEQKAVQIEHLIGELTRFLTSNLVRVRRSGPESRFLPIKTPDDLDAARDDIRELYDGDS